MHLPAELVARFEGVVWRSPGPDPLARLACLFASCFNHSQLTRFLAQHRDGSVAAELPVNSGLSELCWLAVVELGRRGWIDDQLFAHLLFVRPGRAHDIDAVAWSYG